MNSLKRLVLAGSLVAVTAGAASAGAKWSIQVHVNLKEHWAIGALGSARNSYDGIQYIGCYMFAIPGVAAPIGVCTALTASDVIASCVFVDSPAHTAVVQSMASDSVVSFGWDDAGQCTSIQTEKFSMYEPKQ